MSQTTPSIERLSEQLTALNQPQKMKILVVDDEPDNLDLLYRTFRREFRVLRAESGAAALDVLEAEGEVAVIISDQRMPEMKGTEFLSRTVPQFPNTVRIILTGFTDVEDLVEAINAGQVYKYITKPWNPSDLKDVVNHASENYQLLRHQADSVYRAHLQSQLLSRIIQETDRATLPSVTLNNLVQAFGEGLSADVCCIQPLDENCAFTPTGGLYQTSEMTSLEALASEPLIQEAIATTSIQLIADIETHHSLSTHPYYSQTGISSHLAIPLMQREKVFAVLSLQWKHSLNQLNLVKEDIELIHLTARQLSLSLAYYLQHSPGMSQSVA
ncbi:MAG: response regulator [Elainellaceae cyanobacterium]